MLSIVFQDNFFSKTPYESAIKRLVMYLNLNKDREIISAHNTEIFRTDAYPDANFSWMYVHKNPTYPAWVKSQTGVYIIFAKCHVLLVPGLQTGTAISTMEAKTILSLSGLESSSLSSISASYLARQWDFQLEYRH